MAKAGEEDLPHVERLRDPHFVPLLPRVISMHPLHPSPGPHLAETPWAQ